MTKLLSIVIPTKNRYKYLKGSLEVLTKLDPFYVEVLVQDNTQDNSEIIEFLKDKKFSNIVYFHKKQAISITENSDQAIKNSTGKYVCFIGDDDAVCDNIIEVVKYLDKNDIEACSSPPVKYNWPDVVYVKEKSPDLMIYTRQDGKITEIDSLKELDIILRTSIFNITRLPKVYQGIVSRKVLDNVYMKTNSYSPGASPDIANAGALCIIVKKQIHIDMHIIISGQSYSSAAGMSARGKHVNELKNVPWISQKVLDEWNSKIPFIWTGDTIWMESLLKALDAMGAKEQYNSFNIAAFYANFILHNPQCVRLAAFTSKRAFVTSIPYLLFLIVKKIYQRISIKLNPGNKSILVPYSETISSLNQAFDQMNEYNRKYDLNLIFAENKDNTLSS